MTAISISWVARSPIQIAQSIRNGKPVAASVQNEIATSVGFAVNVRPKSIFRAFGGLANGDGTSLIPDSLDTRVRWRCAFRAAPYASHLRVRLEIAPETSGPTDPYCKVEINAAGDPTVLGHAIIHGGSSAGAAADDPVNMGGGGVFVTDVASDLLLFELVPGTEYEATFSDVGHGRLQSGSLWELALAPHTANGYPQNTIAVGAPVLRSHRSVPAEMAGAQWIHGSTQLWNWTAVQASAGITAGPGDARKNLFDQTSTAPDQTHAASTPRVMLDMRQRSTLARSAAGVPVRFKVYASATDIGDTGTVRLINDDDYLIDVPITGGAGWYVGVGLLPETLTEYEVYYGGTTTGSLTVHAFSLYEYDEYGSTVEVAIEDDPVTIRGSALLADSSLI